MNCLEEELSKTNVFRLDILLPLIKILDAYATFKADLSPDEFCICLFVEDGPTDRCKLDSNPVRERLNLDEFKTLSNAVRNNAIDLFMNIVRYSAFLKSISEDYLAKRNGWGEELHETMALVYALSYKIFNLHFEESVECFVHFKTRRILDIVAYLLREETPNFYHVTGCSTFEEDFVERTLVLPFLEATPCLEKLREQLKKNIRGTRMPKRKLTIPLTMNVLCRPKGYIKVPPNTPADQSTMKFANEVPRTNYVKPRTQLRLESLRTVNKTNATNLLRDANLNAPSCFQRRPVPAKSRETEKPEKSVARKSVPTFKPVEVKQTTTSTLRECARLISNEEKELKILKAMTEGGLDPSSISKFEEEKKHQQREEELLKIQEKHLLALLSREGAFIAKQSLLNDVKVHAENVRKEKQELYERLEKWREDHNKEMLEIVEKCREIEQASRDAFNAMINEKKQKAAEISEESRQLKEQLIKQREEETRRKIKLIQEIKTIQSLRALPFKDFDPTESSGLGLLCEMSLAELKERLFWTKMKFDEDVKSRKCVIHRERERQKNMIKDTRKALEEYKESKRATATPAKSPKQEPSVTSPEIEALRKKLEERRALRLRKK